MPIHEYLCEDCRRVFSFFVRSLASQKEPTCPRCGKGDMRRTFSPFATLRRKTKSSAAPASGEDRPGEGGPPGGPDLDDPRVEREMMKLMTQMEHMDENDPRAMAHFMRKLSDLSGEKLGPGTEEAIRRMEAGEDPEKVEEEMGDLLAEETGGMFGGGEGAPSYDEGLYDL